MKIAVMQPYLFPYIGYFQLITAVDTFVLFDDVNFIKRGWINRNRILSGGTDLMVTIPLVKASQNKKINQLDIADDTGWKGKLLKTFEYNYRRAPFFNERIPLIRSIIMNEEVCLASFIKNSIRLLLNELENKTELRSTAGRYGNEHLKGAERILDICKQEHADTYINPPGGKELYDARMFSGAGIDLLFLEPQINEYKQFDNHFVPGLSVIDVLMFNSNRDIKDMLTRYRLVAND